MLEAKLAPSMMCADIFDLRNTVRLFEKHRTAYLHMDVMDGVFVPNIMLGSEMVRRMRSESGIPLDIHLMIENPDEKLEWFDPRPGDYVSVHVEAARHLQRTLAKIRSLGAKPMAAVNPATPLSALEEVWCDLDGVLVMTVNPGFAGQTLVPQTLEKIRRLRRLLDDRGFDKVEIEVDGNVTLENALKMRAAGANIFVAGTSLVFRPGNMEDHLALFDKAIIDKTVAGAASL